MFIIQWSIPLMLSQLIMCDVTTVANYMDAKKFSYHWKINNFSNKSRTATEKSSQASFLKGIPFEFNCTVKSDCENIDRNMICFKNTCYCGQNYIYIYSNEKRCFKKAKIYEECVYNFQCSSTMHNTICRNEKCQCLYGYTFNGVACTIRRSKSKGEEIYTAALVAVSCIMVAVTCILIVCVVKKSSQLRNYQHRNSRSGQPNDVFTIADEIAAVRAADKPPTYEEVMRNEEMMYGVPPPDYPTSSTLPRFDSTIFLPGPSHLNTVLTNTIENEIGNINNETSANFHQYPSLSCSEDNNQVNINHCSSEKDSEIKTDNEITIVINQPNTDVNTRQSEQTNSTSREGSSEAYTNLAFETDI
ncbi:uncharacterized protein [Centruroides vittatus]|uniref:uncharacterized protein isoform X1 n=1 Tax=Centruroides vittatus TaxID=120091 RepID=UPI00350F833A